MEEVLLENLTELASLRGLQNLGSVGYFSLQNTSVPDITSLRKLKQATGIVAFDSNPLLMNLKGLGNLKRIDGDLAFRETGIASLEGLACDSVIHGQIILTENQNLKDLRGLNHIVEVGGDLPELKDIAPLKKVGMIGGGLRLSSSACMEPDFMTVLEPKVLGSPPRNAAQIPEGETFISIKQPSSCM